MVVNILYHTDYSSQASSLKIAIKENWSDASVNLIGLRDNIGGAKYQVQLFGDIVSRSNSPVDNTTIINLIKERL